MRRSLLLLIIIGCGAFSTFAQIKYRTSGRITFPRDYVPGEKDALVVIDGHVYGSIRLATDLPLASDKNPLAQIDPDNIKSMTILKNRAATDLYGDKARYGVIIVTTKKDTKAPKE